MAEEIALAEAAGLYFPVGGTTGAPGLIRGLRSVTFFKEFAEAIANFCPQAWVINYTNPMSICTRTLTRVAPEIKVFGCCHEVFATQRMLARLAGKYLDIETPQPNEIQVNVLGINHFTWVDCATYQGHNLLELLRQHVAQPGFVRSPETLFRWGVIRTPVGWRIERWRNAPQKTRDLMSGATPLALKTSGEEGIGQIKALVGLGDMVTNVNTENQGQIANLPLRAVVETNAHFSRDQVRPLVAGALPNGLSALINQHSTHQELIIEAALTHDLAFQAFYNDPAHHLSIDGAWELFKKMVEIGREHLPGDSLSSRSHEPLS